MFYFCFFFLVFLGEVNNEKILIFVFQLGGTGGGGCVYGRKDFIRSGLFFNLNSIKRRPEKCQHIHTQTETYLVICRSTTDGQRPVLWSRFPVSKPQPTTCRWTFLERPRDVSRRNVRLVPFESLPFRIYYPRVRRRLVLVSNVLVSFGHLTSVSLRSFAQHTDPDT